MSYEHQTELTSISSKNKLQTPDIYPSQKPNQESRGQSERKKSSTQTACSQWKTVGKRNKKLSPQPIIVNIKDSNQLLQYAEEAMDSDSYNYDSCADEENTMFEVFDHT